MSSRYPVSPAELGEILLGWAVSNEIHATVANRFADDIAPHVIARELVFFRVFVVDHCLVRAPSIIELHGMRCVEVLTEFVRYTKRLALAWGMDEETWLDSVETRLSRYNAAFDAWHEGHRIEKAGGKRPPNSVLIMAETFLEFCDSGPRRLTNPALVIPLDLCLNSQIGPLCNLLQQYEVR